MMRPLTCAALPPSSQDPEYSPRSPCHSTFHCWHRPFSSRDRNPFTGDIGSAMSRAVMQKRPMRFAAMPPERVNSHVPGCIGLASAHAGSAANSPSSTKAVVRIGGSDDHHVDEFVDRRGGEPAGIQAQVENRRLLLGGEAPR